MKICKAKGCGNEVTGSAKYCAFHRSLYGRAIQKRIQKAAWRKMKREGKRDSSLVAAK